MHLLRKMSVAVVALGIAGASAFDAKISEASTLLSLPSTLNTNGELGTAITELNLATGTNDFDDLMILGKLEFELDGVHDVHESGAGTYVTSDGVPGLKITVSNVVFKDEDTADQEIIMADFGIDTSMVAMDGIELVAFYAVSGNVPASLWYEDMFAGIKILDGSGIASNKGFSHITALGFKTTVVPLPAALPLFLSALGLLGLFGRRRRRLAAA